MDNNLIFHETLTIEQFKNRQHVNKLEVKKNPKSGKLFMTYGAKTAAVSLKGVPQKPMVSLVTPKDAQPTVNRFGEFDESKIGSDRDAATFWMLHEEGQGGAAVVASF